MGKRMNLVGDVYGQLTVVSFSHRTPSNSMAHYLCKCVCGNEKVISHGHLRSGHTKSCGCAYRSGEASPNYSHGKSDTKVHIAWQSMRRRCYDKSSTSYATHGAKGVTVSQVFLDSFLNFYNEIGDPPTDDDSWSVDRIDGRKGYEPGNIRWATYSDQARNRGKMKNNTSGKTGVGFSFRKSDPNRVYASVSWRDLEGVARSKWFSVKKYGLLPAFKMACEYREAIIREMNMQGAGYTPNHGK